MRTIDDKIIYALNTTIPTDSFRKQTDAKTKCKDLHEQLTNSRQQRESAIKKCLVIAAGKVQSLKNERESNTDDLKLLKKLRAEQTKVRFMRVLCRFYIIFFVVSSITSRIKRGGGGQTTNFKSFPRTL